MACDRALLVQAYLDGEVDAEGAVAVETHLASCPACAALLESGQGLRDALRETVPYHRAPQRLRAAIVGQYGAAVPVPRRAPRPAGYFRQPAFLAGALGGAGSMLAAAVLAFVLLIPNSGDLLVEDVAAAHMRSLMAGHLIDVASTDQHTVKPWFDGRVDVAPPVGDFAAEGFDLVGGRLDYLDGRSVAAVVYRRGKHVINLFAWADGDESLPSVATRNGYRFLFWRAEGLVFCAVSDVALPDLQDLKALVEASAASQGRE